MTKPTSLYQQVIAVTNELLGPASERFIIRQIHNHLGKKPEELTQEDLDQLIDWLKLSISLLTEDTETIHTFTGELRALAKK